MESDNKCRHRIYAVHTQEETYKTNSPGFKVLDPSRRIENGNDFAICTLILQQHSQITDTYRNLLESITEHRNEEVHCNQHGSETVSGEQQVSSDFGDLSVFIRVKG